MAPLHTCPVVGAVFAHPTLSVALTPVLRKLTKYGFESMAPESKRDSWKVVIFIFPLQIKSVTLEKQR
jgi:hypothetical protein